MKNFEDLKIIENKKYSPKEALAYFVVSAKNVMNKNLESYMTSLKEELLKNSNNKQILENLKLESLEKVINYWSLSVKEVLSYGYIVFSNLLFENKELTERKIADMFIYVMRIYSPSNVIERWNIENNAWIGGISDDRKNIKR